MRFMVLRRLPPGSEVLSFMLGVATAVDAEDARRGACVNILMAGCQCNVFVNVQ